MGVLHLYLLWRIKKENIRVRFAGRRSVEGDSENLSWRRRFLLSQSDQHYLPYVPCRPLILLPHDFDGTVRRIDDVLRCIFGNLEQVGHTVHSLQLGLSDLMDTLRSRDDGLPCSANPGRAGHYGVPVTS